MSKKELESLMQLLKSENQDSANLGFGMLLHNRKVNFQRLIEEMSDEDLLIVSNNLYQFYKSHSYCNLVSDFYQEYPYAKEFCDCISYYCKGYGEYYFTLALHRIIQKDCTQKQYWNPFHFIHIFNIYKQDGTTHYSNRP